VRRKTEWSKPDRDQRAGLAEQVQQRYNSASHQHATLSAQGKHTVDRSQETFTKAQEVRSFLFLTAVMAPLLAVLIVAGYGFLVWIYQMFAGPPGPMGH
jgi:nitrate reductase NapE